MVMPLYRMMDPVVRTEAAAPPPLPPPAVAPSPQEAGDGEGEGDGVVGGGGTAAHVHQPHQQQPLPPAMGKEFPEPDEEMRLRCPGKSAKVGFEVVVVFLADVFFLLVEFHFLRVRLFVLFAFGLSPHALSQGRLCLFPHATLRAPLTAISFHAPL
jgi:hypothetical protein